MDSFKPFHEIDVLAEAIVKTIGMFS